MSLSDIQIFTWKSKATQEKEQEDYEKWAFPHGLKQREALEKLLLSVYPKESVPTTLIPFLTCKELYEGVLKKNGSRESAIDILLNTQKKYKRIIKKKDMPTYVALVIADAGIDEQCHYPSAEEIIKSAAGIEKMRRED